MTTPDVRRTCYRKAGAYGNLKPIAIEESLGVWKTRSIARFPCDNYTARLLYYRALHSFIHEYNAR